MAKKKKKKKGFFFFWQSEEGMSLWNNCALIHPANWHDANSDWVKNANIWAAITRLSFVLYTEQQWDWSLSLWAMLIHMSSENWPLLFFVPSPALSAYWLMQWFKLAVTQTKYLPYTKRFRKKVWNLKKYLWNQWGTYILEYKYRK